MRYVIIALIGALASVLSNQGIAVFNDGFRPIVGQYFNKEISRKELAAMSFAISFGLVIGFGIPTSIAASIILIHCLLLTTDIIGSFCPDTKVGMIISAAVGAVYGLALLAGLEFIVNLFGMMPYNFTSDLGGVSNYVTVAFAVFPAVGVAYQHGFKKGTITAGVTVLVYYLIKKFGVFSIAGNTVSLNAEGMAMLAGMVMMIVFAAQIKGESNSNEALTQGFSGNVSRIRKNWFLLAIMGGLIAASSCTRHWLYPAGIYNRDCNRCVWYGRMYVCICGRSSASWKSDSRFCCGRAGNGCGDSAYQSVCKGNG